jgi:hypothetical protein
MNPRHPLLLAVLASLTLAACGGDDGPTREEFARQADRVCAQARTADDDLGSPDNARELVTFTDRLIKVTDDVVTKMKAIERPSGDDGEKAEQFVTAFERDVDQKLKPALGDLRTAAQEGDAQGLRRAAERLEKVETPESDRLARELGARGCAD